MQMSEAQTAINQHWNEASDGYDEQAGHGMHSERERGAWLTALRDLLPAPPLEILDVGAGTGFLTLLLAELGYQVTALDPAEGMLAVARSKSVGREPAPRFEIGDGHAPPFVPGSFDAVVNRHVLWTLLEPERALASWFALLRPGGTLLVIDALWFAGRSAQQEAEAEEERRRGSTSYDEIAPFLPLRRVESMEPIIALAERAGFSAITLSHLDAVEAIERQQLPSGRTMPAPRYALRATRPA